MARGMPQHARKLTDLLEEKRQLNRQIGVFFRQVRSDVSESQTEFAQSLGISQPYLSQIENGVRTPSWETIDKLHSIVTEGETSGSEDQEQE